ncbi:MAG: PorT family protein [Saprospiraceae bacterium]|nr:PorT family protein [Saprospiraceae bacterium]
MINFKRLILTLTGYLILCSCLPLVAQKKTTPVHFGFHLRPASNQLVTNEETFDLKIQQNLSVAFGASLSFPLGQAWELGTGIFYHRLLVTHEDLFFVADCSPGATGTDIQQTFIKTQNNVHYLGIPFTASFNFIPRKHSIYTSLELNPLIKINNRQKFYLLECGQEIESTQPAFQVNNLLMNIRLGVGVEFLVDDQIRLGVEPFSELSLNTFYSDSDLLDKALKRARFWQVGVSLYINRIKK